MAVVPGCPWPGCLNPSENGEEGKFCAEHMEELLSRAFHERDTGRCRWPGCGVTLAARADRGPKRWYCDPHREAAKRETWRRSQVRRQKRKTVEIPDTHSSV